MIKQLASVKVMICSGMFVGSWHLDCTMSLDLHAELGYKTERVTSLTGLRKERRVSRHNRKTSGVDA